MKGTIAMRTAMMLFCFVILIGCSQNSPTQVATTPTPHNTTFTIVQATFPETVDTIYFKSLVTDTFHLKIAEMGRTNDYASSHLLYADIAVTSGNAGYFANTLRTYPFIVSVFVDGIVVW